MITSETAEKIIRYTKLIELAKTYSDCLPNCAASFSIRSLSSMENATFDIYDFEISKTILRALIQFYQISLDELNSVAKIEADKKTIE